MKWLILPDWIGLNYLYQTLTYDELYKLLSPSELENFAFRYFIQAKLLSLIK